MTYVCLYHRTDTSEKSVEDILLRAFGCKKTSSTLICPACNNVLGSGIDHQLAESLSLITTLIAPKGRRQEAPTQRGVVNQDGVEFDILPGGEVKIPHKKLDDLKWQGAPEDLTRMTEIANQVAKGKNLDPCLINVERGKIEVGTISQSIKVSFELAYRSACKSALEALALIAFDEADRRSDLLLDVRDFVMKGGNLQNVGWMTKSVRGDSAFLGCRHSLLLIQAPDMSVYFEFVLYGGIIAVSGRFGRITKKFDAWLYEVEPLSGTAETETSPGISVPDGLVTWTQDSSVNTKRIEQKMPEISLLARLRVLLGKHMEPLLSKVWKDHAEFKAAIHKLIEGYVREQVTSGRDSMEVMKEILEQLGEDSLGQELDAV